MNQTQFLELVGNNIKRVRLARGLRVEILAEKIGIPASAFERIEAGIVETSLTDIYDISSLLEIDPVELFK